MKKIIRNLVFAGLTLSSLNASATYFISPLRCPMDSKPRQSKEAATGRLAWVAKCYPEAMEILNLSLNPNDNVIKSNSYVDTFIYPALGTRDHYGNSTIIEGPIDANAECNVLDDKAPGQKISVVDFCEGRPF